MHEVVPSAPRALPALIAVAGQVATGKSSVARRLAERIDAV
jgi:deoxyadenosine/deoxycytidine kinase